jgi:hypothetical protein
MLRLRNVGVLVAVVALCAACTSSVSGRGTGHSVAASPAGPSTPAVVTTHPATSSGPSSSTPGGGTVASDWAAHVDFGSLAHPDLDCSRAGLGGKVDVLKVISADVTGDGVPDAVVRMECAHSASEWPDTVDVYSDTAGTPTMIGSLLTQHDSSYAPTINTHPAGVTLGLARWSKYAPGCCPDLHYTRTFTWTGHGFSAGPLLDQLHPCRDTAFDVSAGDQQGATGHSSIVLRFRNRLPQPCAIQGYPGLDAVTSTGAVLAHAARTLNGFAGGAHTVSLLTVASGQTASALAEWMNFDPATSGPCPTSASIMVTPANTSNTVSLPVHVTVCGLQIHPTVAGTSGNA